ncbi:glycerate kinase [Caulobacter sp. CCG-8]|uniref:glycerate kinase type-2 family protein n=1 Tax=Caulobacter sp. CCG-8 TaxID=3127958 RepID=UPI00307CFA1D
MFDAAVDAASPASRLPSFLPDPPRGRTIVVGAGKAAAAMARAVETHWPEPLSGLVVTRYGHAIPCERIEVVEAAHPVSDAAGARAAQAILERVRGLTEDDLVLCLLSGGGSALLAAPGEGVTLADKQAVTRALLKSGAPIGEINCVRKHLSAIKGGRLALAAAPTKVVTLVISDVPGDDPAVIASGPTLGDPRTSAEALAILERRLDTVPDAVRAWLLDPRSETPGPDAVRADVRMIATPAKSLEAAAAVAREHGYTPVVLGDRIEGEAREIAGEHADLVQCLMALTRRRRGRWAVLSGGETTVTVRGGGRGGRNAEFLLALAVALDGLPGVHALAADTDGIDGSEDNAGAVLGPETPTLARRLGLNARDRLDDNDGYGFFQAVGGLVVTGPTLTNVNDFRAILIDPSVASREFR